MSSKKYYWLKLKTDFFNLREIKKLRKIAGGDTFTIIYLKMQLLSIKSDGIIKFEGTEEHFDHQLALELDEELDNVRLTLAFLHSNMLIEPLNDEDYLLPKVCELIGIESDSAERVRRHRNKSSEIALQCNATVTECNGNVTKCNTEIEIDLEKEKELELKSENIKNIVPDYKPPGDVFPKNKQFKPPTLDDVKAYCTERKNSVDPQSFIDFYSSKGWMIGKNKMKCWQSAVRTWEKNRNGGNQYGVNQGRANPYPDQYADYKPLTFD